MNKVITDGLVLMPPAFADGLENWSRQDGTPGSDTYATASNAAFVPADADFGGCLELVKLDSVQKLRCVGQTPLLPGCYLRVRAMVKAVSGPLPSVRIAAFAAQVGGAHLDGVIETGPEVLLTEYGRVTEISAIIGVGARSGVDMVWGRDAAYGHFGLDLTGTTGSVVRIDDFIIEDITSAFLREMMSSVDVRDFGAKGDGVTDDLAAFEAADAAADGKRVIVPKGQYRLGDHMTFENAVHFEGMLVMDRAHSLNLTKDFRLPAYIDAFGSEEEGFKRALQALFGNSDHESLDLDGRRITITEPVDVYEVTGRSKYSIHRHLHNGQFDVKAGAAWDTEVFTSVGTYSVSRGTVLTDVTNVANIPVGALVEGSGVGREVYVKAKDVDAQEITLSQQLFDAEGTQTFTFRRFKYVLDFSGMADLDRFSMGEIEFRLHGEASGILLAPKGLIFSVSHCYFTGPKDRALTSPGEGCQGMLIDNCQFLSNENPIASQNRTTIAFNTNGNDVKLRSNRAVKFRHFAVMAGSGSVITGNHFFQGDGESNGLRLGGLVITGTNCRATIDGNYIDNCFIEWSNEHDNEPEFSSEYSFSQLNVSNNIFLCSSVAPWFSFFVIKPHGAGHFVNGLNVQGNFFRTIGGEIERADRVDSTFATLNNGRMRNVNWRDNMYNGVSVHTANPLIVSHEEESAAEAWNVSAGNDLPLDGEVRKVEAIVAEGAIRDSGNVKRFVMPYVSYGETARREEATLHWGQALRGKVAVTMRIDSPS